MSARFIVSKAFLLGLATGYLLSSSMERVVRNSASDFATIQQAHLRRLDGASVDGRVVFLGGSTFQGFDISSVTPIGLNLSIGGDTLPALTIRAARYRSLATASAVVINIGLNDLAIDCAQPLGNIEDVFALIPSATSIVVLGVQGVNPAKYLGHCHATLNDLIAEFNQRLVKSCSLRTGCVFVPNPVRPAISPGAIDHLQESDGIHLSRIGYGELSEMLRKALLRERTHLHVTP
jgi:hypothetical protein